MSKRKPIPTRDDPWPYSGPLRRADGAAPFNHHLWPMGDAFHPSALEPVRVPGWFYWYVIPLNNGCWLADGYINSKQYPTRTAALRVAAAKVIRRARAARHWRGMDGLDDEQFRALIGWVYGTLERPAPRIYVAPPPPPPTPSSLLEIMEARP